MIMSQSGNAVLQEPDSSGSNPDPDTTATMGNLGADDECRAAKFFRIASNSTFDQFLSGCTKKYVRDVCKELMDEVPPKSDRRFHQAVLTLSKNLYATEFKNFMNENDLDEKLKTLERTADETKDRKKKPQPAWRPTGLSASEQQRAHDLAVKESKLATLKELIAAKEKKVKELQETVVAKREAAKVVKQSVGELMITAAEEYKDCQKVTDPMLTFINES